MRTIFTIILFLAVTQVPTSYSQQALFVKKDALPSGKRVVRQTSADQMVQNILQWLQGVYTQNNRKIRQGTLREYLPPSNTQKPRPFQPVTQISIGGGQTGGDSNFIGGGYPAAGSITPRPPFPIYTSPVTGGITGGGYPGLQPEIIPPDNVPYPYPQKPQPPFNTPGSGYPQTNPPIPTRYPGPSTAYPGPSTAYPGTSTGYPGTSTGYPGTSTGYPGTSTGYPGTSTGYPGTSTGFPSTTGYPRPSTSYPTTGYPTPSTTYPSPTEYPTSSTGYPTSSPQPFPTGPPTSYPTRPSTGYPTATFSTQQPTRPSYAPSTAQPEYTSPGEGFSTSRPSTYRPFTTTTPSPDENLIPSERPGDNKPTDTEITGTITPDAEDLKHPPHIHEINVECSKEMMTIDIEFNRQFDGIIYSKGHFNTPDCRYVNENSGKTKYKFTVSLNSCGTEFVNAFDTQGKSYLENILVLQNEPGIQEVWDTIRAVRCLWEGNLKKALNVGLSVGMLSQEIVTFSGDTAMARLDIQIGKGPFAPPANGLIKIGEIMTLVVSVTGDPGFDIQVKDCRAKDSAGDNTVQLTDNDGCVLKPKLFGAFQKTRNTGDSGASIIAYAFFNAFKFPDVMDLILECNVELCKTDCEVCPDPNQNTEPGRRRRRDLYFQNQTDDESITIGKMLKVILPEDLTEAKSIIDLPQNEGLCITTQSFIISSTLFISVLTASCIFSAYIWFKYQRISVKH